MSRRSRQVPGQIDLFGETAQATDIVPVPQPAPKIGFGGKADAVVEVLDQVHNGRFGLLENNDRVVHIDGEKHCRHACDADASTVESLIAQRYAKPAGVESMRHGAVRRNVVVLALTLGGRGLLRRSSMLQTRRPK